MNEELKMRYPDWPVGRVAHAEDCKSLYIGSIPVPASKNSLDGRILFRLSSAVEQSAVNRLVACSNQAAGANKKTSPRGRFFYWLWVICLSSDQREPVVHRQSMGQVVKKYHNQNTKLK